MKTNLRTFKYFSPTIKIIIFVGISIVFLSFMQEGFTPKEGFVPNDSTAIRIAEAVWLPIYGKKIYEETPFKAKLIDNKIWIVEGTLPGTKNQKKDGKVHISVGGVVHAEIQKSDGKILKVIHGQ
jgi:hypothetical protein